MKILYLAHRIPYPPNKGDKIRSFNEIKHLSKNHEIYLCCLADNPKDIKYTNELKKYCKTVSVVKINPKLSKLKSALYIFSNQPLTVPYFYSRSLQKTINRLLSAIAFDCIFCFSSPMAEYVFKSKTYKNNPDSRSTRLIMDFVDVDSDKWIQYSMNERWPLGLVYKLEGKRLADYEKQIANSFDHSIFVSNNEAAVFKSFCLQSNNIAAIPNGVDVEYFSPEVPVGSLFIDQESNKINPDKKSSILLFTGAMDYNANVDGVMWFCEKIFPAIRSRFHDVLFYIAGSNPDQKVLNLKNIEGVHVTGFVDDIRPYYKTADICVVPLRMARGIQNKVLEAMAMGRPVVATSRAIQGIKPDNGKQVIVADSPDGFAFNVVNLLKEKKKREEIGKNNLTWVKKNYRWPTHMNRLEQLIIS